MTKSQLITVSANYWNTQGPDAAVASLPPPVELDEPVIESLHLISRDTDRHLWQPLH